MARIRCRPVTASGALANMASQERLNPLFAPAGIAIVGASGSEGSMFARPLQYLRANGYEGSLFPVNPSYDHIDDLRCYPSLGELPLGLVDLVLVLTRGDTVVDLLEQSHAIGARAAIVFSSGFADADDGGERDRCLSRFIARTGMTVLGPNCQGLIDSTTGVVATFTAAARRLLPRSGISYVGQSGALGGSLLSLAADAGIGFDAWVSTGNQANVDAVEVASWLMHRPTTSVLALYLEQTPDGSAFAELLATARATSTSLVLLRSGRTEAGRRAVASHTGALVAGSVGLEKLASRSGAVLVDDLDELLNVSVALRSIPALAGPRVGVITTSGGAGGIASDLCETGGLTMANLAEATQARLHEFVPSFGSVANPVDVTAQLVRPCGSDFQSVVSAVLDDPAVDVCLVILTMVGPETGEHFAVQILDLDRARPGRLIVVWLSSPGDAGDGLRMLQQGSVPVFRRIGDAVRVMSAIAQRKPFSTLMEPVGVPSADELARLIDRPVMVEGDASALAAALGLPFPEMLKTTAQREAARWAAGRSPVVMKVHSPDLLHKSELGGVRVGVEAEDVPAVFDELMDVGRKAGASDVAVVLEELVEPGLELLVGFVAGERGYPMTLTVGLGGVIAELTGDIATDVTPVDADGVRRLLRSLKGWPLFAGYRGAPAFDLDTLCVTIARLSYAMASLSDVIREVEINPLVVRAETEGGVMALDFVLLRHDAPRNVRPT